MKKYLCFLLFIACWLMLQTASAQVFYKTPFGKKFHLASCRMVENVSEKLSLTHAMKLGLAPCKICKPPMLAAAIPISNKKTQDTDNTVQCKGFTKAGTRCKHMTSIANGYCFQHKPG